LTKKGLGNILGVFSETHLVTLNSLVKGKEGFIFALAEEGKSFD
jgi:hypothetical protein